ncbi:hypothetical protein MWU75_17000 [Ornithinimicrobium sp. F0845]|uniref:hypothetical protein n=1 Tax=Ornithinimicrobium sp. F0845 TaxID=2926412 RepID=UPI001FF11EFF|nr:hypothetical protein [Ornithinimicrobium sp. F0845]MCK0113846.1 hypothetical protein [Ornithinimicrobium sp. F0845]
MTTSRSRRAAVLVTALLIGTACSSGDGENAQDPPGDASPPAAPAPAESAPPDPASPTPTAGSGRWDPQAWEPTVQVTLGTLSSADREQWRADYLAQLGDQLDGPVPDVPLERWVHPKAEWDAAMSACMGDSGFPVEVEGGGISYPGGPPPADQLSAWDLAWYQCNARFTPDPDYMRDWTEEQIGLVYDYWDQYFIPCMEAHGHPINTAVQPSRGTYISTFFTPEPSWWPNRYIEMLPPAERERLAPTCAPYPPDDVFYGF